MGNKLTKSSSTATANISCQTDLHQQQPLNKQQKFSPHCTLYRQSSANDNNSSLTIDINNQSNIANNIDKLSIATNNSSSSPYISCDNLLNVVKLSPALSSSINALGNTPNLGDYRPLSALYDIICKEKEYDTMSSFIDKTKDNGGPGGGGCVGGNIRDDIASSHNNTVGHQSINGDHTYKGHPDDYYHQYPHHRHSPVDHHLTFNQTQVNAADVSLDSDLINSSSCTNNFNNSAMLSSTSYSNTKLIDRNLQQYSDEKRRHLDLLSNGKNSKFEKENDCDIRSAVQQMANNNNNVTGAGVSDRFVINHRYFL